ncbi:4-hydroxy-tetrahydrodipicolinate synthase [Roseomonas aerophila]|uniref:4-hydroxy-tetrahydrodipicolinate synthase n=1 Tax=Teichococcus aerophilus TaxID=1224513 RepID=A0ABR7RRC4_9PROT|nr:4-hydroxy-tetrahydrodipicolinate synthase [Pseudoroseomonas aerophila]MBC9209132.1 4-hydroxy-tetrahydrodipicolinate synthase [Pseudoroseomonas aerophila]
MGRPYLRQPLPGGSMPALVTPFRPGDGEIDDHALAHLADRAVERGASALVVCGSTGEAPAMTPQEQARALHIVVEAADGRVPVIAGIGGACTQAAVALAGAARQGGAAALLVAAPPYVKPSQDGMRAHLRAVSGCTTLPVILYDVPGRVGVGFSDDNIARLYEEGVVQALKDATADLARPHRLRRLCGMEFQQYSGDDATAAAHRLMGGAGCISVTANVAPALCAAVMEAWSRQEIDRLLELNNALAPLHEALFAETNPGPVKAALALSGLCDAAPRLPLLRAGATLVARLEVILAELSPLEETLARRRREAPRMMAEVLALARHGRA